MDFTTHWYIKNWMSPDAPYKADLNRSVDLDEYWMLITQPNLHSYDEYLHTKKCDLF
jgi:hypothetical protein